MYNLPCTYGATTISERDSFLAETQDIILTVLLYHRTDKMRNFCFHPCPKADEASCDIIRKLFSFFSHKGQNFIMTSEKENKLYFML